MAYKMSKNSASDHVNLDVVALIKDVPTRRAVDALRKGDVKAAAIMEACRYLVSINLTYAADMLDIGIAMNLSSIIEDAGKIIRGAKEGVFVRQTIDRLNEAIYQLFSKRDRDSRPTSPEQGSES